MHMCDCRLEGGVAQQRNASADECQASVLMKVKPHIGHSDIFKSSSTGTLGAPHMYPWRSAMVRELCFFLSDLGSMAQLVCACGVYWGVCGGEGGGL